MLSDKKEKKEQLIQKLSDIKKEIRKAPKRFYSDFTIGVTSLLSFKECKLHSLLSTQFFSSFFKEERFVIRSFVTGNIATKLYELHYSNQEVQDLYKKYTELCSEGIPIHELKKDEILNKIFQITITNSFHEQFVQDYFTYFTRAEQMQIEKDAIKYIKAFYSYVRFTPTVLECEYFLRRGILTGKIDVIYKSNEDIIIADYKTTSISKINADLYNKYCLQVAGGYKYLIEHSPYRTYNQLSPRIILFKKDTSWEVLQISDVKKYYNEFKNLLKDFSYFLLEFIEGNYEFKELTGSRTNICYWCNIKSCPNAYQGGKKG